MGDSLELEVELVKKELVELITQHLKENKIEVEKARKLAADFLAVLPIATWKDLLEKLKKLGTIYPEAKTIYVEEFMKEEEREKHIALDQIREHIKSGKIEEATTIAKSINNKNLNTYA